MSITIFSQSLQNDSNNNLWYENKYFGNNKDVSNANIDLFDFLKSCEIFANKHKYHEEIKCRYSYIKKHLLLYIPSDELDIVGRISPICAKISINKINETKKILNIFLEKSGRHISKEKMSVVEKAVCYAKEQEKINKLYSSTTIASGIGLIGGAVLGHFLTNIGVSKGAIIGVVLTGGLNLAVNYYKSAERRKE